MSATKTTLVAMLLLVLTFSAGFAAGVFTGHMHALRIFRPERLPQFATRAIVGRLDHHLDLTDAQQKRITEIINRHHRAISKIRGSVQPRIGAELEQANREITAVLTPEQRKKYDEIKMRLGPHVRRWHQ